jgi:hypothetical protein
MNPAALAIILNIACMVAWEESKTGLLITALVKLDRLGDAIKGNPVTAIITGTT